MCSRADVWSCVPNSLFVPDPGSVVCPCRRYFIGKRFSRTPPPPPNPSPPGHQGRRMGPGFSYKWPANQYRNSTMILLSAQTLLDLEASTRTSRTGWGQGLGMKGRPAITVTLITMTLLSMQKLLDMRASLEFRNCLGTAFRFELLASQYCDLTNTVLSVLTLPDLGASSLTSRTG